MFSRKDQPIRYPTAWKQKYRKINGQRRLVKVRLIGPGKEQVRVVGYYNATDKNRQPNHPSFGYRRPR